MVDMSASEWHLIIRHLRCRNVTPLLFSHLHLAMAHFIGFMDIQGKCDFSLGGQCALHPSHTHNLLALNCLFKILFENEGPGQTGESSPIRIVESQGHYKSSLTFTTWHGSQSWNPTLHDGWMWNALQYVLCLVIMWKTHVHFTSSLPTLRIINMYTFQCVMLHHA